MAVLQVVMRYRRISGVEMQNVHYATGPTLDGGDLTAFATFIRNAMNSRFANRLPNSFFLNDALGRVVSTQGLPFVPLGVTNITGADASALLPTRLALLMEFRRQAASPNKKRLYFGFWAEGQNDVGQPIAGLLSEADLFIDDLLNLSTLNGKQAAYAVGRYTGTPPYMPTAFALESGQVFVNWASLRSRVA